MADQRSNYRLGSRTPVARIRSAEDLIDQERVSLSCFRPTGSFGVPNPPPPGTLIYLSRESQPPIAKHKPTVPRAEGLAPSPGRQRMPEPHSNRWLATASSCQTYLTHL